MGDRANVHVFDNHGKGVYLYTHWDGYELPQTLAKALKRGRERWDDAPYLARIIFCEMVQGQEGSNEGYGIWDSICDNEHPILEVDCSNLTVDGVAMAEWVEAPKYNEEG